jgi:hypothetical protein
LQEYRTSFYEYFGMDEIERGYHRERGAAQYRAKSSTLGCLIGLAIAAVVLVVLTLISALLGFVLSA